MSKAKDKWMKSSDFTYIYELDRNHVHVTRYNKNPHWIKRNKKPKKLALITVNYGFLERVSKFRESMNNEAHDIYYRLTEDGYTQWSLAKELSEHTKYTQDSWSTFMQKNLFTTLDDQMTILFTTIRPMLIAFVRHGRRLKETT